MAGGFTPPGIAPRPGMSQAQQAPLAVKQAADAHGVPESILLGVWGMETGFGTNVKTSSAGAIGDFQFLPGTARGYNYPLTNSPSALQFSQQANAAAQYLSDLHRETGSWDEALRRYSGGGYGLNEVQSSAGAFKGPQSDLGGIVDNLPGVKQANEVANTAGDILGVLTNIQTWIRVGEAVAGLVLIYLGLKTLTG
jgi:soluble lytic murein transglycosylase-like protein